MHARLLLPLVVATAPAPAAPADGEGPPASAVRALHLPATPGTRIEYFRLDGAPWRAEDGGDGEGAEPLGLVRVLAGADAAGGAGAPPGVQLEREVVFLGENTRVLHTERVHPGEGLLVWREVRARAGRTVLAEWDEAGGLRSAQTMGGETLRHAHDLPRDFALPLALVEEARWNASLGGSFRMFDPLSCSLEEVRVRTRAAAPGEPGERVAEIHRADGSLAGRYAFRGAVLVAFQWQVGGAVARPVGREAFQGWYEEGFEDAEDALDVEAILREVLTRR